MRDCCGGPVAVRAATSSVPPDCPTVGGEGRELEAATAEPKCAPIDAAHLDPRIGRAARSQCRTETKARGGLTHAGVMAGSGRCARSPSTVGCVEGGDGGAGLSAERSEILLHPHGERGGWAAEHG